MSQEDTDYIEKGVKKFMGLSSKIFIVIGLLFFARTIWVVFNPQIISMFNLMVHIGTIVINYAMSGYIGSGIAFIFMGFLFQYLGKKVENSEN